MFLAKFQQVNSDKFTADKNGMMPYIGTVLAGKATGTIINGTIFEREGLESNQLYACENVKVTLERDGVETEVVNVQIIAKVSILDYVTLQKSLGAPVVEIAETTVTEAAATTKAPKKLGQPVKL